MPRSVRLLVFGVLIPGGIGALVYGRLISDEAGDLERIVETRVDVSMDIQHDFQGTCAHESVVRLSQPARSGTSLRADVGSGSLDVEGKAGLDDVRVLARMCASDADLLDELEVELEREGGALELETSHPSLSGWGGNRYARIDLYVEVPEGMDALVDDSSGEMRLVNLGSVVVDDASGDVEIVGARGSVAIEDGSGGITLTDIGGSVVVDDGSGGVEISGVQGSVEVEDGSGSIELRDIGRDVRVRDGSGSIVVDGVGGDFVVESDGSGGIRHDHVQGRVDIPRRSGR